MRLIATLVDDGRWTAETLQASHSCDAKVREASRPKEDRR
jgi:hypothetical protein